MEDESRTHERLRRGEVVGAVSIQPRPLPGCLADQLGALDYLFVASPEFAARYFPDGVSRSALLKALAVAFDYLDDMHMAFLQTNFDLALAVCRATYSIPRKPLCSWQNRVQPVV